MNTRWFSLRRRLLLLLTGSIAACWLIAMSVSYIDAHHEIDELFDAQLAQAGQALLAIAGRGDDDENIEEIAHGGHKYQRRMRFQIWNADGTLVLRSRNAPQVAMAAPEGFSESKDASGHWRYYTQWNHEHTLQVQVAENHRGRDELVRHIALRLLYPALLGLPLLALCIWFATRAGLAPLAGIAREIAGRDPRQLQPITPATAPDEIAPLLGALNDLFRRVEGALENERRFTADAAHELRTPLAALQAQLQVAQRARDADERERSLANVDAGLRRAAHLVEQMLLLARLDPERGLPDPQAVDLALLATEVCAELGTRILDRKLDFGIETAADATVAGQREWLRVLLRNLIDNAVRYTPGGGRLRVSVRRDAGGVCLQVDDSGPGIATEARAQALQRFHRLGEGACDTEGSGLGLSIVARIAELHGARLQLDDADGGGLSVRVVFPD